MDCVLPMSSCSGGDSILATGCLRIALCQLCKRGEVGGRNQRACAYAFAASTEYSGRTEPVPSQTRSRRRPGDDVRLLTCTAMSTSSKRPSSAAVPSASFRSAVVCSSRAACSSSTLFDLRQVNERSDMASNLQVPCRGVSAGWLCSAACLALMHAAPSERRCPPA